MLIEIIASIEELTALSEALGKIAQYM